MGYQVATHRGYIIKFLSLYEICDTFITVFPSRLICNIFMNNTQSSVKLWAPFGKLFWEVMNICYTIYIHVNEYEDHAAKAFSIHMRHVTFKIATQMYSLKIAEMYHCLLKFEREIYTEIISF